MFIMLSKLTKILIEKNLVISLANILPLVMPNNKADGSTELEKAIVKEIYVKGKIINIVVK